MSDDCIFCQIIAGKAQCHPVHETRYTRTFLDAFPSTPGHCLIVTKAHFTDIFDSTPEEIAMVGHVSTLIAHTLREELQCDGVGIYQLNGAAAGQTVFHYHMHVIPRMVGQELHIHSRARGAPAELEAMAARLSKRAYSLRTDD
ncbi:HIT family protein [Pseudohalioglobus lutimaris]|uniref:HIT family protein n=1 Tax=Pseudohalioglobus lutimaris TaxID=1737061 RepID=A0A2N5WX78_9GAMM|nr:HIT family protein [Pseudohalioglobus lutimaris]PLW66844.1 HIT family protein [Pseudohalioglobus lutimaris]